MFPDHDVHPDAATAGNDAALIEDLGLETIVAAMANGDRFLAETGMAALLHPLADAEDISFRQGILRDCLEHPAVVRELYDLAVEAITKQRTIFGWLSGRYPAAILSHAVEVLALFATVLRRLRAIASERGGDFASTGFRRFFTMLVSELDDDYFDQIDAHLRRLRLRGGVTISAGLDQGGKGVDLALRRPAKNKPSLGERLSTLTHPDPTFRIAERDEAGANAVGELRGRGINLVADALARSTDHILSFFDMLRSELGFYIGCLNLAETLADAGQTTRFPAARPQDDHRLACAGVADVALVLLNGGPVVGNTVSGGDVRLVVITGANRGGKSTFLRSIGQAQLMMQAGMFVAADTYSCAVRTGVFTHFARAEDATMVSGKLDEELSRMSGIADRIRRGGLILFNESFASTNEREGSQLAREIVHALVRAGIRVFFVTHQYDLAHGWYRDGLASSLFLRAERERTFALVPGEPLPTSFGGDLYRRVFGTSPANAA